MGDRVRNLLGISGGKDSAALAIYLHRLYPELDIEYYFCDTGKELKETLELVERLEVYLKKGITRLKATENEHYEPFDYFLKVIGNYLPSVQQRWCTQKLKLEPFETHVGNSPCISYVGIRGDEDREGYISTKPNIQSIFPFRRNIWSIEILTSFFRNENIETIVALYQEYAPKNILDRALEIVRSPKTVRYTLSKKMKALHQLSVKTFNRVVFEFLRDAGKPVSLLEDFPLLDNEDNLVRDDIFKLLEDSGVGVPAYYKKIPFTVDGMTGEYARSRSGCYFCFFQQRIEWIWLYEQHPDLFKQAAAYEKGDEYTWVQGERLEDLIKPERIRQIKLEAIRRNEQAANRRSPYLIDNIEDAEGITCGNCFI